MGQHISALNILRGIIHIDLLSFREPSTPLRNVVIIHVIMRLKFDPYDAPCITTKPPVAFSRCYRLIKRRDYYFTLVLFENLSFGVRRIMSPLQGTLERLVRSLAFHLE